MRRLTINEKKEVNKKLKCLFFGKAEKKRRQMYEQIYQKNQGYYLCDELEIIIGDYIWLKYMDWLLNESGEKYTFEEASKQSYDTIDYPIITGVTYYDITEGESYLVPFFPSIETDESSFFYQDYLQDIASNAEDLLEYARKASNKNFAKKREQSKCVI